MLSPDEKVAFDVYFASVTSMQYHPGAGTKDHARLSLEECRDVAAQMIALRRKEIEEN
jgi:hypothetical protein